uniref:Uncharacterized protein n=1 Tax=Anguilla anguilla TaxID=7936 RepID=A0A0E9TIP8_ANGAN
MASESVKISRCYPVLCCEACVYFSHSATCRSGLFASTLYIPVVHISNVQYIL